ncbi:MAG: cytochrome c biogenesis protein CcsA [Thermotogae bacterium]|nr:cytochrome c biogenesis protein CcsA [Thermotogota bacterium]
MRPRLLVLGSLFLVAITQLYAFFVVPPVQWPGPNGQLLGKVQKIFYVHVPMAWVGFFLAFLSALFGLLHLVKRDLRWDRLSASSMEVATLFLTMAVITGSLWAKPSWGTFWTWDPRLVSMAVLLILAVGYLFLRNLIDEENLRGRISALLSLIIVTNIPAVFLSIKLLRTLHPAVVKGLSKGDTYGMDTPILVGLLLNLASMTLLGLTVVLFRWKNMEGEGCS